MAKACLRSGGARAWNRWRQRNAGAQPDLRGVVLDGANLARWDLAGAVLDGASLVRCSLGAARLQRASLRGALLMDAVLDSIHADGADFSAANCRTAHFEHADCRGAWFEERAYLSGVDLTDADFSGAHLAEACLVDAVLRRTRLDGADLSSADLQGAVLDSTSLRGSCLRDAIVADALIRRVSTDDATDQHGLLVNLHMAWQRPRGERIIFTYADDLRVAQFQNVVDEPGAVGKLLAAATQRVVLILGRFTPRRLAVLKALAAALGERGKIAVIFDFPAPRQREISDTVRFIAGMSQFIVVDLTDASSVPLELQATVPELMVPVLPIVRAGRRAFAMLSDLQRRYFWVQPTLQYRSAAELVRAVDAAVLERAAKAARLIEERRAVAEAKPLRLPRR